MHFVLTRYRVVGVGDWQAAIVCIFLMFAMSVGFGYYLIPADYLGDNVVFLSFSVFVYAFVASVPVLYIIRLRALGITDADFHIKDGINYESALRSATHGFDFQGVGAAKLTKNDGSFRAALKSAHQAKQKIRFLLLNPDSAGAIGSMERSDGASGYKQRVEGSINFIKSVSDSLEKVADVALYNAGDVKEVEPFRIFLTEEACLVSPFVSNTGVEDQGQSLPQIRIAKYGFPRKGSPTLYRAFHDSFEKSWYAAVEKKTEGKNELA